MMVTNILQNHIEHGVEMIRPEIIKLRDLALNESIIYRWGSYDIKIANLATVSYSVDKWVSVWLKNNVYYKINDEESEILSEVFKNKMKRKQEAEDAEVIKEFEHTLRGL